MTDDFPRRRAATRGFRLGMPRTFTISSDGQRVLYLRSAGAEQQVNDLWLARHAEQGWREERAVDADALLAGGDEELTPAERTRRERMREVSGGITAYSADDALTIAAFVLSGTLWCHDVGTGATTRLGSGLADPTVAPTGAFVAGTRAGAVEVISLADGTRHTLVEPDGNDVAWGVPEFVAAEEMARHTGLWWSPDGDRLLIARVDEEPVATWWIADPAAPDRPPVAQRYPACGTANARVTLHLVDLAGHQTEVGWDAQEFEYLAAVSWTAGCDPVIACQNRSQTVLATLAVDPATGATRELHRQTDPRWVELVAGLPRRTARGLAVAHVDSDADCRRLVVLDDGGRTVAQTPDGLQLRSAVAADEDGIVLVGSQDDPTTCDLWRLRFDGAVARLSSGGGWAAGTARGGTTVVVRADESGPSSTAELRAGAGEPWVVPSHAERPDLGIRPEFLADETGWHRIAVLWPNTPNNGPLPVVLSPYGGPHSQRVVRAAGAFATEQWLADQGFCVVVADGPGSPSRPGNEYAIHRDLGYRPLEGQVTALLAVLQRYGDRLDRTRVGIRGWSFGGYLAAFAVMERPDLFAAAVAGAPVTDWPLYDTHYTERYLGLPDDEPAAYAHASLLNKAHRLRRPLLLIHGLADDNVFAAHTLQLSRALLAAGKPHTVVPLSGETHLTRQLAITENLLRLELEFLREALA